MCFDDVAIILPSLDPDRKFLSVIDGLVQSGFQHVIIVDDGSKTENQSYFSEAEKYSQCKVLHHEVNKGKGRALKTAFSYVLNELPKMKGVVTIDGDGQHLTKDIIACAEKMLERENNVILGCRDFDAPNVPPRSVAGNKSTNRLFSIFFGIKISDTQTGLRAIPKLYLEEFIRIDGERFEYETNMLLQMRKMKIDFYEQPIETVYDQEDYSSHYHAVRDTARVAKVMLKFLLNRK